jgi:hypothetical protein
MRCQFQRDHYLVDLWVVAAVRTVVVSQPSPGQQPRRNPAGHHHYGGVEA